MDRVSRRRTRVNRSTGTPFGIALRFGGVPQNRVGDSIDAQFQALWLLHGTSNPEPHNLVESEVVVWSGEHDFSALEGP